VTYSISPTHFPVKNNLTNLLTQRHQARQKTIIIENNADPTPLIPGQTPRMQGNLHTSVIPAQAGI
jgi:hypothetical protein